MTSPSPAPLTDAEKAVAEALRANPFGCHMNGEVCDECAESFRAVVAAVRPILAKELHESADLVYQFAQSRPVTSAEARAIFDGIATSLSLPASKETDEARG